MPDEESVDRDDFDVAVVGGGLAGLAAAAVAAGEGRRVVLLDPRALGGRARTDRRGGFLFNQGPRALYRSGAGRAVLGRLGISPTGGQPPASDAYGLRDGELLPLPSNARRLLTSRLIGGPSKAKLGSLLGRFQRIDASGLAGLSISGWIASLGLRPDAEALITTIMHVATYVGDFDTCSADAGVAQVQMALGAGVDYLDGGWQQLVDALASTAEARGVEIRTDQRVVAVQPAPGGVDGWVVSTPSTDIGAGAVVLTVGSPAATAALLPVDPGWELGPDCTAACLDLGLRRAPDPRIVFGVGRPLYLSTHCPPADLAPEGQFVAHLLRYGARTTEADSAELWALAAAAGITEADVVTDRFLHRMIVAHALPRPGSGLAGRPPVEVPGLRGVFVAGDWVGPVGMLADASLASAEAAARAAVACAPRTTAVA